MVGGPAHPMDDQGATQLSLLCHEASTRRSGLFILLRLVGFSMGTHSHPGPNHPKFRWNVSRPGSLTSIGKLEKNDFGQPGYSNHCPAKGSGRAAPASSNIRGVGFGSADYLGVRRRCAGDSSIFCHPAIAGAACGRMKRGFNVTLRMPLRWLGASLLRGSSSRVFS